MIFWFVHVIFALWLGLVVSVQLPASANELQIIKKPEPSTIKAIYLTGYTAGWKERRQELIDLVNNTELNAVVIDIKDSTGRIFYDSDIPEVDKIGAEDIRIPDLHEWLKELEKQGIYTIARIVVFQDPYLAQKHPEIALKSELGGLWHDYKGLSWVDPTEKFVWNYNLNVAREAIQMGFDELNFDYIRFPSDGNIKQIVYANLDNNTFEAKSKIMAEFYKFMGESLKYEPVITSADLFGMTLWRSDGMNIGQRYEDAAPYFDFIAPMVYPSHYPAGFEGFANPAENPYEIIYRSLIRENNLIIPNKKAQLRPWLQDFDLGAVYTPEMIIAQKQATYDAGGNGWMLWNASNRYTVGGLSQE